jgi:hypothetical protein
LLEFGRALPEIDIVAHPVFPDQVKQANWWARRGTAALLVSEYMKYLGALSRPLFGGWEQSVAGRFEPDRAETHP